MPVVEVESTEQGQWADKRYFTGTPCRNGHVAERRITDNRCVECVRQAHFRRGNGKWVKQNPEVRKRYDQSDNGKEQHARYRKTERRRVSALKYTKTPKGRASQYRTNHSEKYKSYRAEWNRTPKGRATAIRNSHAHRARKNGVDSIQYTFEDRIARFAEFGNCCAYCGNGSELSEDHVVPIGRSGVHRIENIVPCCLSCNKRKNAQDVEQWYKRQVFFTDDRWARIREIIECHTQKT